MFVRPEAAVGGASGGSEAVARAEVLLFNLGVRVRDEYVLRCVSTAKDTLKEFGRCFLQLEHNGDMVILS